MNELLPSLDRKSTEFYAIWRGDIVYHRSRFNASKWFLPHIARPMIFLKMDRAAHSSNIKKARIGCTFIFLVFFRSPHPSVSHTKIHHSNWNETVISFLLANPLSILSAENFLLPHGSESSVEDERPHLADPSGNIEFQPGHSSSIASEEASFHWYDEVLFLSIRQWEWVLWEIAFIPR